MCIKSLKVFFNLFDSKAVTTVAVVTSPVNDAVGSIQTTPDRDLSTVGTSTGDDEETKPTVDKTLEDDYCNICST